MSHDSMAGPSVAQWIYRAAEDEGLADAMSDPAAKRLMFSIAAGYERLAEHASARKERQKDVDALIAPAPPGAMLPGNLPQMRTELPAWLDRDGQGDGQRHTIWAFIAACEVIPADSKIDPCPCPMRD